MDTFGSNLATYVENLATSEENMDTSEGNMDTSEGNMDTSPPKKWLSKQELGNLIISAVREQPKSLEEIAIIVGKTAKYLKNAIVPDIVKSGKMEMLYPDNPNHPFQKYKATK